MRTGVLIFLTVQSQQKILKVVDRVFADLGKALGFEDHGYDRVIEVVRAGIREHGSALSTLLLSWAKKMLPVDSQNVSVTPENFDEYLALMETREKAAAVLLALPEPDWHKLDLMLNALKTALPSLRQALLPIAKQLPHAPGGRPKELPDQEDRRRIRKEIKDLREPGVKLEDLFGRMASRYGVSPTTIKRIWLEGKENDK